MRVDRAIIAEFDSHLLALRDLPFDNGEKHLRIVFFVGKQRSLMSD